MKTIIKVPLYIEIETEDGLDRKGISASIRSYFIPEFYRVLKSKDLIAWMYSSELKKLRPDCGINSRFRFITESDLFVPKKNDTSGHEPWNEFLKNS